jgi:hypothetical protein
MMSHRLPPAPRADLAVAIFATWLLTRHERRKPPHALVEGYPVAEFPRLDSLGGLLASLCRTQSTLLSMYRQLPAASSARPRLLAFLEELRGVMDGAYELALSPTSQGRERLARLSHEAQSAAEEMAKSTQRLLSEPNESSLDTELDVRLEIMRTLARDADDL